MEENKLEQTKAIYAQLLRVLDKHDISYKKDDEDMTVSCMAQGDDLPISMMFLLRNDSQTLLSVSSMPFTVPEDKRIDMAVAVCVANRGLVDSTFDFDINDGSVYFRMPLQYGGNSRLSDELIEHMLSITVGITDHYNDRFFMLAKGLITLEKFIEMDNGNND